MFSYKRLKLKAAADSGVSLLARGSVLVGRDTEAPCPREWLPVADGAAEGPLPRAGALSGEGLAPEETTRQAWTMGH